MGSGQANQEIGKEFIFFLQFAYCDSLIGGDFIAKSLGNLVSHLLVKRLFKK